MVAAAIVARVNLAMRYNTRPLRTPTRRPETKGEHCVSQDLLERHQSTLDGALAAIVDRGSWSAYPEVPSGKIYGETARADGESAFKACLGSPWGDGDGDRVGDEVSPYGLALGVTYPLRSADALIDAAKAASTQWARASIEERSGVCLEVLHRLNQRSFEMAHAVMHTTGQGFMMAFQAGGPHAQDRGLEALAWAWRAMHECPPSATWRKQVGREEFVTLNKTYRLVPRGISLAIGCSTFPTWNTYPGLIASLATGNTVLVKPHPGARLPLAITVEICRAVLEEAGYDPDVVQLAADSVDTPIAQDLVGRPEIGVIDYTGSSAFGSWIEDHAGDSAVFTEKAGVNCMVIDSVEDLRPVTGNLAFSLCLYSGQMCTTPQNILVPRDGIETADGHLSFDEVATAIVKGVDWMLSDPARASEVLGAIQSQDTADRVDATDGTVLRAGGSVDHEHFPDARTRGPRILQVDAADLDTYGQEMFGPVVYVVATDSSDHSIELAASMARSQGAISFGIYSTSDEVLTAAQDTMTAAGVPVSCNLLGSIWVNQSAAFSDFHVSGCNPSGNATLTDAAFIAGRFRFVQCRIPVPEAAHAGV